VTRKIKNIDIADILGFSNIDIGKAISTHLYLIFQIIFNKEIVFVKYLQIWR